MDWKQFAVICLVSSVGLVCYFNTMKAGFVYDDNRAIIENADIKSHTPWTNIWYNDFWGTPLSHSGSHKSYRPLCVLSFRMNYMLDGLNPRWYHFGNTLLHSIVCGLFTALAFALLKDTTQCLVAGMLFAVHPIHSEAVAGVVGRADIGCGLFFILSLMFYQRATVSVKLDIEKPCGGAIITWYFMLSIICCVLSILFKEIGITVLGLMIAYDVIFIMEPKFTGVSDMLKKASAKGTLQRVSALMITGGLLLYLRFAVMSLTTPVFSASDNPAADHPDFIVRLLTFLYLPVFNVSLLLFPWQLSFDWSMDSIPLITTVSDSRNLASVIMYSSLVFFLCKFIKKNIRRSDNDSQITSKADSESPGCSTRKKFDKKYRNKPSYAQIDNGKYFYRLPLNPFANGCFKNNFFKGSSCSNITSHGDIVVQNGTDNKNGSSIQNGRIIQNGGNESDRSCGEKGVKNGLYGENKIHENCEACIGRQGNEFTNENGFSPALVSKTNNCNGFERNLRKRNHKIEDFSSDENLEYYDQITQYNDYNAGVFSLVMMILPFLPATNLFFYVGFVVAERILYIPSMGFCLLVALGYGKLAEKFHKFRPFLKLSAVILIASFAIRTLVRNEDWFDEEALYRSGLETNPPKAWGNLANILSQQGRITEAEDAYRNALQHRTNMGDTHYNLGILLQNSQRYKEAIDCYQNAIKYRPSLASAYLNLGLTYDAIGLKKEAIKILNSGKNLSDFGLKNPKAHLHSLTAIRYNLGKIFFNMADYKASISLFYEAIEIAPSSYSCHSIYNMLGQAYSFLGQSEDAEIWYWKSLQSNKTHIPAHLTYARHLASKGKTADAENWFLKALKLQSNYADTRFHYGQFLISNGRSKEGLAELERAVELNPDDAEFVVFAASSFREAKDYGKAEKYYKKAILLDPNASNNHMNLGALYHLTGRLDEAEVSYFEALRLNPGDQLTLGNIRKLKSLKQQAES